MEDEKEDDKRVQRFWSQDLVETRFGECVVFDFRCFPAQKHLSKSQEVDHRAQCFVEKLLHSRRGQRRVCAISEWVEKEGSEAKKGGLME